MSHRGFEQDYASAYDEMYADKDYEHECELLQTVLAAAGVGSGASLLDLGCGTGNHTLGLAERGYRLTGVDVSSGMLEVARRKAERHASLDISFEEADIRSLDLNGTFDAAIMMFAVLSYQLENADVIAALQAVRRHLRVGAPLLFDIWYGPAVLSTRPSTRVKVGHSEASHVDWVRISSGQLETFSNTCSVEMRVFRPRNGELEDLSEHHVVRYFFAKEIELLLDLCGFVLDRISAFPNVDDAPSDSTWNVMVVARAV